MNCYPVKNSKEVKPGNIFFSIAGQKENGNNFIKEAVQNGAIKIFAQKDNIIDNEIILFLINSNIKFEYVDNIYYEFACAIKSFYGDVFLDIVFIGVTGTKGKTTTCNALFNFLRASSYNTALMSSAFHKINDTIEKSKLTTEMINDIYSFLKKAKESNVTHVILEVSAQAFTQYRIFGILFDVFIFTNFSQEHGESYKTQDDYFSAKCELYKYLKPNALVLLNQEDKRILESSIYAINKNEINIKTFSSDLSMESDIFFKIQSNSIFISQALFYYKNNTYIFNSPWLGIYNISNIACAFLALDELLFLEQKEKLFLLKQVEYFENIPGRNEKYFLTNNRVLCIEKAHTPNSIESSLLLLRSLTSKLIVVFGCGGEKDTVKRPELAKIVETFADIIYVSSDNPRNEPLENIFLDISKGFCFKKDIFFIADRKKAIEYAIEKADSESIIVLFGKGDETFQYVQNKVYYFSEKEIIQKYIV
jgi:UDP-N-acetylmuramoyl-L-alanyl-D-glutamate--2,6-diaminopimelate ligase